MSIILMESADLSSVEGAKWSNFSSVTFGQVRDSRTCWGTTDGSVDRLRKDFPSQESSTIIVGARFWQSSIVPGDGYIGFWGDGGTVKHMVLYGEGSGEVSVRRGGTTSLGSSGTGVFAPSQWHYVEMKVTCHDTTGSVDVRVDGVSVISLTNVDTRNGGTDALIDRITFGGPNVSGSPIVAWWRDIVIMNDSGSSFNDMIGPVSVQAVLPDGAGNYTAWTPNTGANYAAVDETPASDGDTTYVESTSTGQRDSYSFANTSLGSVDAVQAHATARYNTAPLSLATFLRRSATDDDGTPEVPSASYGTRALTIWETDPIAAGAWNLTNFNATEFGVVSST